jgi:hypothetical protein
MSNDSLSIFDKMSGGKKQAETWTSVRSKSQRFGTTAAGSNTAMKFSALLAVSGRVRK